MKIFPPFEMPTVVGGVNVIQISVYCPVMDEFSHSIKIVGSGSPYSLGVKNTPLVVSM